MSLPAVGGAVTAAGGLLCSDQVDQLTSIDAGALEEHPREDGLEAGVARRKALPGAVQRPPLGDVAGGP